MIWTNPRKPTPKDLLKFLELCLLSDVSIREPAHGLQALHLLFLGVGEKCLDTQMFIILALNLIDRGGADVSARTYDGDSPMDLALENGCLREWLEVLVRSRISIDEVIAKDLQHRHRFRYLGNGDSTAINTDDLAPIHSEALTRRRPVIGDRLVE